MGGECRKVLDVGTEDHAARFGTGHDDGVHGGALAGEMAKLACSTGERRRQDLSDITGLEQPVHGCVTVLSSSDHFGENDRRYKGWPRSVAYERTDGGYCFLIPLGKKADSPRVQDEHAQFALDARAFSPRTRPASRSALATDAGEGSPTSSMSSERYRSVSSSNSWRRSSARTAPCSNSDAGR